VMFRGVTKVEHADQFRTGEMRYSAGMMGVGSYWGTQGLAERFALGKNQSIYLDRT